MFQRMELFLVNIIRNCFVRPEFIRENKKVRTTKNWPRKRSRKKKVYSFFLGRFLRRERIFFLFSWPLSFFLFFFSLVAFLAENVFPFFFLNCFPGRKRVVLFSYFLGFFYKFPPLYVVVFSACRNFPKGQRYTWMLLFRILQVYRSLEEVRAGVIFHKYGALSFYFTTFFPSSNSYFNNLLEEEQKINHFNYLY